MFSFHYTDLVHTIATNCNCFKWQLMTAESCTGGMVAAALSTPAGASSWFRGGVVAYQNEIKQTLLQVEDSILKQHGAVSKETALAMCAGLKKMGADAGISITGIAGPDGGSTEKPVGLVWFGFFTPQQQCYADFQEFAGDRDTVRARATHYALRHFATLTNAATYTHATDTHAT